MITIALSKGYMLSESLKLFQKVGARVDTMEEISRKLQFVDQSGQFRFLIIRPSDVPVYVEYGAADLGIAGKDVLVEGGYETAELLDLKFGQCRLAVAGLKERGLTADNLHSGLRVATKFINSAAEYFNNKGLDVELIKLYGSVELGPISGLSDLIVDLVASGKTLKENGLEVIDTIYESTARLIGNRVKIKSRFNDIISLTKQIQEVL